MQFKYEPSPHGVLACDLDVGDFFTETDPDAGDRENAVIHQRVLLSNPLASKVNRINSNYIFSLNTSTNIVEFTEFFDPVYKVTVKGTWTY